MPRDVLDATALLIAAGAIDFVDRHLTSWAPHAVLEREGVIMPRPTDLAVVFPFQPLADLVERAHAYPVDARASSARKACLSDFASFEAWCAPSPPR